MFKILTAVGLLLALSSPAAFAETHAECVKKSKDLLKERKHAYDLELQEQGGKAKTSEEQKAYRDNLEQISKIEIANCPK